MFAAVLLVAGIAGTAWPQYNSREWVRWVPSAVLAWWAPLERTGQGASWWTPGPRPKVLASGGAQSSPGTWSGFMKMSGPPLPSFGDQLSVEVWRRFDAGLLSTWEERAVLRRYVDRLDSPEESDAVLRALSPRMVDAGEEGPKLVFSDRSRADAWARLDLEVAYRFEILLDGKVIGSGSAEAAIRPVWKTWTTPSVEWVEDGAAAAGSGGAEIIVRGDPDAGARLYMTHRFDRDRAACWAGESRAPLGVTRERP